MSTPFGSGAGTEAIAQETVDGIDYSIADFRVRFLRRSGDTLWFKRADRGHILTKEQLDALAAAVLRRLRASTDKAVEELLGKTDRIGIE